MMKVVGEEGTSLDDYVVYLKGEFLDAVYLQQNSFDPVDAAVSPARQKTMFRLAIQLLASQIEFSDKEDAREFFYELRQTMLDLNGTPEDSEKYSSLYSRIETLVSERKPTLENRGREVIAALE